MKEEYFNTETVTCCYYAIIIIILSLQLTAKCIYSADVAPSGKWLWQEWKNFENGKTKIDFYINRSFFFTYYSEMWGSHYMASQNPLKNSFGMQIWPLKPFLSKPQLIGIYFLEADTIVFFMVANHPLFFFFWQLPSCWMEVILQEAGNDCSRSAVQRFFTSSSFFFCRSRSPTGAITGSGEKKKIPLAPVCVAVWIVCRFFFHCVAAALLRHFVFSPNVWNITDGSTALVPFQFH